MRSHCQVCRELLDLAGCVEISELKDARPVGQLFTVAHVLRIGSVTTEAIVEI